MKHRDALPQSEPEHASRDSMGSAEPVSLASIPVGCAARVAAVRAPADAPEWSRWLEELGFLPGERVAVMTRGAFGGDPLVVRVGMSTFALRRAEAGCVLVECQELGDGPQSAVSE